MLNHDYCSWLNCCSLSHVWLFVTPWIARKDRLPRPSRACSNIHWAHDAIQPSCPLSSASPATFNFSKYQSLFQWVDSLHQVPKVLELKLQHQSFQWTPRPDLLYDGLVGSPCSPRDSQESSPKPQYKSINSLVLSFLYGPTFTSIHDYWKNHKFD